MTAHPLRLAAAALLLALAGCNSMRAGWTIQICWQPPSADELRARMIALRYWLVQRVFEGRLPRQVLWAPGGGPS